PELVLGKVRVNRMPSAGYGNGISEIAVALAAIDHWIRRALHGNRSHCRLSALKEAVAAPHPALPVTIKAFLRNDANRPTPAFGGWQDLDRVEQRPCPLPLKMQMQRAIGGRGNILEYFQVRDVAASGVGNDIEPG